MNVTFSSVAHRVCLSIIAMLALTATAQAQDSADKKPRPHGPKFSPPVHQPPVYQPPVYQPPVYQPPVYQPPVYQPPKYEPPKVDYTPPPKRWTPKYRPPVHEEKIVYRNSFVPIYEERVVEVPVVVEKKVYVEKPTKATKYWVKEVHYGRCVNSYEADVHKIASHASELLGRVRPGVKLHIKQCLTDKKGNWKWCSFDTNSGTEAWIPAKFLEVCGGY